MLTYSFSRREKALLLVLAVILLFLAWFVFVFQRTADEINRIDNEISVVDTQTTVASTQVKRMNAMQEAISKYKAAGVSPTPVPAFDNMTPLMTELNAIMAGTTTYTLSFDDLDTDTSSDYVLRGVTADFGCNSVSEAELVVTALAKGAYPCSIDSVSISDSTAGRASRVAGVSGLGAVSASVHVTFFEKRLPASAAASSTGASSAASASSGAAASATSASSSKAA